MELHSLPPHRRRHHKPTTPPAVLTRGAGIPFIGAEGNVVTFCDAGDDASSVVGGVAFGADGGVFDPISAWKGAGGRRSFDAASSTSVRSGRSGKSGSGAASLLAYGSNPHNVKHFTKGLRPLRIPRYEGTAEHRYSAPAFRAFTSIKEPNQKLVVMSTLAIGHDYGQSLDMPSSDV